MKTTWSRRRRCRGSMRRYRRFEEPTRRARQRGQIIVMFAIFLVGDAGYARSGHRRRLHAGGEAGGSGRGGCRRDGRGADNRPLHLGDADQAPRARSTTVVAKNNFGPVTPTVLSLRVHRQQLGGRRHLQPERALERRRCPRPDPVDRSRPGSFASSPARRSTVTVGGYAKARVQNAAKGSGRRARSSSAASTPGTSRAIRPGRVPAIGTTSTSCRAPRRCGSIRPRSVKPSASTTRISTRRATPTAARTTDSSRDWPISRRTPASRRTSGSTTTPAPTPGSIETKVDGAGGCPRERARRTTAS